MYVSVMERGLGLDGGWLPLPTRPQLYLDPASLVFTRLFHWLVAIFFQLLESSSLFLQVDLFGLSDLSDHGAPTVAHRAPRRPPEAYTQCYITSYLTFFVKCRKQNVIYDSHGSIN